MIEFNNLSLEKSKEINLLKISNYKEHFFLKDGLKNISYDLDFSIFKKYRCFAGCDICYLKNDWIKKQDFVKTALTEKPKSSQVEKLLNIFSHFDLVSIIDDLFFLKNKYPELFSFYQEHQSVFYLSSMTDNSIVRHKKVIEEGFRPIAIHEISISDDFLQKVGFDLVAKNLEFIHNIVPIKKIKHLLFLSCESTSNSEKLISWAKSFDIKIEKQLEYSANTETNIDLYRNKNVLIDDARSGESTTYSESFSDIYPVNNEILFLMYDAFYTELRSATSSDRNNSFCGIDSFNSLSFLAEVLKEKIRVYKLYTDKIKNNESDSFKYFKYVTENLLVNENFNFIPSILLGSYTKYYQQLVQQKLMIETPYGLVSPSFNKENTVRPIINFKET